MGLDTAHYALDLLFTRLTTPSTCCCEPHDVVAASGFADVGRMMTSPAAAGTAAGWPCLRLCAQPHPADERLVLAVACCVCVCVRVRVSPWCSSSCLGRACRGCGAVLCVDNYSPMECGMPARLGRFVSCIDCSTALAAIVFVAVPDCVGFIRCLMTASAAAGTADRLAWFAAVHPRSPAGGWLSPSRLCV